ncbi:MAG: flagellar export chaperone FliS [Butyrivibrio sp.]
MINTTAGYNQYQNSKVLTATPAELTLMLYEGAIKFANKAIMAIDKRDMEGAHTNIIKTQRIIEELRATLNFKYPVAKEFDKVYEYLLRRLIDANVKKSTEILEECLEHLRTMRDTWKDVMRLAKAGSGSTGSAAVGK